MVIGDAFGQHATVEIIRLADGVVGSPEQSGHVWPGRGTKLEVLQPSDNSLKFIVPATLRPGVFVFRIATAGGTAAGLLNRPAIWWTQGNLGTATSPGMSLHLYGREPRRRRCGRGAGGDRLPQRTAGGQRQPARGPSLLRPKAMRMKRPPPCRRTCRRATTRSWSQRPRRHCGVESAGDRRVEKPQPWPQTVFNVKDFDALGTGIKDDTTAVQAALAAAENRGGGVVFFPAAATSSPLC